MRKTWKSTTALIATLSLAFPTPGVAQAKTKGEVPKFMCMDGTETPCEKGVKKIKSDKMICEDGAPLPCAEGVHAVPKTAMICDDGTDLPCADGVAASLRPEMAEQLEAMRKGVVTEEAVEAAPAPTDTDAPAAEAEAETNTETNAEAAVEADVTQEAAPAEAPAETQTTAEADAPAEEAPAEEVPAEEVPAEEAQVEETPLENAEAAPAPEAPAEEAPVAEQSPQTDEIVQTEQAADATAEADPAPSDEAAAGSTPAPGGDAVAVEAPEADGQAESATEADANADATAQDGTASVADDTTAEAPESELTSEEEAALAEALAETETVEETAEQAEPVPDLPVQPEAESGEAPVAAAANASADAEADAEVSEEVVTEETARSSDEDFATKITEAPKDASENNPDAKMSDDKEGGLTKGEKAILLGLGAVAVGAMLSNNREVALNSGDRVVVSRDDGTYEVIKDDNALLRQPGTKIRTQTFGDGSTRTTVIRPDGTEIVTIRDPEYRVLRRVYVAADGTETILIDDTVDVEPVDVASLPAPAPQPELTADADEEALRAALAREAELDRRFSLAQIRHIPQVRYLVPVIDLDAITFETGSAAIRPDQARSLARLGKLIQSYIEQDRNEVFLIEGHTDAVGAAAYNLALSDRRAESVALALTEYFDVPPENLIVQGYGEAFLKIETQDAERANRRASVRRITQLLR